MEKKTIDKALSVIDNAMQNYQRMLEEERKIESNSPNGNPNIADEESNIEKYEIILSDLAIIREAIKNEKDEWCEVKIRGTAEDTNCMYPETYQTLEDAGFDIDGDCQGLGMLLLFPKEEN